MQLAFRELGYHKVWHATSTNEDLRNSDIWNELRITKFVQGKAITREDFDRVLAEYAAVTDAPCWAFWDDLMVCLLEDLYCLRWHGWHGTHGDKTSVLWI